MKHLVAVGSQTYVDWATWERNVAVRGRCEARWGGDFTGHPLRCTGLAGHGEPHVFAVEPDEQLLRERVRELRQTHRVKRFVRSIMSRCLSLI